MIKAKVRHAPAPSSAAASSISLDSPRKKPVSRMTVKGSDVPT